MPLNLAAGGEGGRRQLRLSRTTLPRSLCARGRPPSLRAARTHRSTSGRCVGPRYAAWQQGGPCYVVLAAFCPLLPEPRPQDPQRAPGVLWVPFRQSTCTRFIRGDTVWERQNSLWSRCSRWHLQVMCPSLEPTGLKTAPHSAAGDKGFALWPEFGAEHEAAGSSRTPFPHFCLGAGVRWRSLWHPDLCLRSSGAYSFSARGEGVDT
jgi:hypothetical protein